MKEEELPTMYEVFESFKKGEIKEGNYVVCRLDKESNSRMWMPYEEIRLSVELNDKWNKERNILLWDLNKTT